MDNISDSRSKPEITVPLQESIIDLERTVYEITGSHDSALEPLSEDTWTSLQARGLINFLKPNLDMLISGLPEKKNSTFYRIVKHQNTIFALSSKLDINRFIACACWFSQRKFELADTERTNLINALSRWDPIMSPIFVNFVESCRKRFRTQLIKRYPKPNPRLGDLEAARRVPEASNSHTLRIKDKKETLEYILGLLTEDNNLDLHLTKEASTDRVELNLTRQQSDNLCMHLAK